MTKKTYFVGFNTVDSIQAPFTLVDIELVKRDLLNIFHTRMGERVMLPNFGSRIHDLLMDPFDNVTKQAIIDDAIRVIRLEPRVELVDIAVDSQDQTIVIEIVLNFVPQKVKDTLYVNFTLNNKEII